MNPISAIFGAGITIRNTLYDRRILKAHKLTRPVISVGNISVGGTGKTPFVIALGELLKLQGIAFDVLSRGYGRSSGDIAIVDPDGTPASFGDEPLLMARKLHVPIIVGADRYQAGLLAEKQFFSKLHLLDDGFQHRRLHRDFDIVLLPAEDYGGTLLPVGRLREPLKALRRADAVVLQESLELSPEPKRVWNVRRKIEIAESSGRLIAFCGIGRPQQFFDALQAHGQEVAGTMVFQDHHRYAQSDINRFLETKKKLNADGFITTEKDAINLGGLATQLAPLQMASLCMEFKSPERVISEILQTLEQRCACKF